MSGGADRLAPEILVLDDIPLASFGGVEHSIHTGLVVVLVLSCVYNSTKNDPLPNGQIDPDADVVF